MNNLLSVKKSNNKIVSEKKERKELDWIKMNWNGMGIGMGMLKNKIIKFGFHLLFY